MSIVEAWKNTEASGFTWNVLLIPFASGHSSLQVTIDYWAITQLQVGGLPSLYESPFKW